MAHKRDWNALIPIGLVWGRWVVIGEATREPNGRYFVLCRCECGTERQIACLRILPAAIPSCGCIQNAPAHIRFWRYVQQIPNGCWIWTGGLNGDGYGNFKGEETQMLAHRWAYQHWIGPISPGLVMDHLCRNRACVNPAHLEAVPNRENLIRGARRNQYVGKSHCRNGHVMDAIATVTSLPEMRYTMLRQTDNGPWVVPTNMHRQQPREYLIPMLDMIDRSARNDTRGIADVTREGDTLSYRRIIDSPAHRLKPGTMTWRILEEEALQAARAAGVRIEYREASKP